MLAALVVLAYLPSLSGGFLNWDDDWLFLRSPLFSNHAGSLVPAIFGDWSLRTRLALGAEYLPVRDLFVLLEAKLFGLDPLALRLVQLALYVAAVLLMRGAFLRTLGSSLGAEVAAFAFALHPVHVESVAWLSGLKDVLALVFVAAAVRAYAGSSRHCVWVVPLLLLFAHFSKSVTVVSLGFLVATDFAKQRRPDWAVYGLAALTALFALRVHLEVGRLVHMTGAPVGGSRMAALMTMGPVWLRYLWVSLWPGAASLVHDVDPLTRWTLPSVLGYLVIAASGVAAFAWWRRRGNGLPFAVWLWFWVPLAPVSQVVFPLQNLMADRYLFLSITAVALALGAWAGTGGRALLFSTSVLALWLAGTTYRAVLFSSNVAVFADATHETRTSLVAPYQLGMAFQSERDEPGARSAFEEVLKRARGTADTARRATNNLAKIYAHEGRLDDARSILERGVSSWPTDRKMLRNLLIVRARLGDTEGARALEQKLETLPDRSDYPD